MDTCGSGGDRGSFADGDPNWYPSDDPRSYVLTAMQVPNLSNIVSIAAGGGGNLALDASGKLWSHGSSWSGTLGNGRTDLAGNIPVAVSVTGKVVAFSVGEHHDLALTQDDAVWAWGQNTSGQLGVSFSGTNPTPAKIALPGRSRLPKFGSNRATRAGHSRTASGREALVVCSKADGHDHQLPAVRGDRYTWRVSST